MVDLLIAAASALGAAFFLFILAVLALSSGKHALLWICLAVAGLAFIAGLKFTATSGVPPGLTRRVRNGMASLCLAFFAGAVVAVFGYFLAARPPKQETVAIALRDHRGELDRLKDMAVADRLETVVRFGEAFSRPEQPLIFKPAAESGLAAARVAEYSRLMRSVDSERIDVWQDGTVHLSFAGWGGANRGWRVSLAFSAVEPKPLVATIDGFPGAPTPGAPNYAFSRLDGSWYVYIIR